jgi:hypothetical protein
VLDAGEARSFAFLGLESPTFAPASTHSLKLELTGIRTFGDFQFYAHRRLAHLQIKLPFAAFVSFACRG